MVYFYILSLSNTILEKRFLFFYIKTNLQYGKYMNQQTKHCCIELHVSYKMLCEFFNPYNTNAKHIVIFLNI
jgi:hypothetical protein